MCSHYFLVEGLFYYICLCFRVVGLLQWIKIGEPDSQKEACRTGGPLVGLGPLPHGTQELPCSVVILSMQGQ